MKACYEQLANWAGFQEGDRVRLYSLAQKTGKSPKLQKCWEYPYIIINQNKWHSRAKMTVIHLIESSA